jgi:hypothetical protein
VLVGYARPGGPGGGDDLERPARREQPRAPVAQLGAPGRVEPGDVVTRRAHAERERLPPVVETREAHPDGEHTRLDLVQPGRREELGQVTLAGAGQRRLVPRPRIGFEDSTPEH